MTRRQKQRARHDMMIWGQAMPITPIVGFFGTLIYSVVNPQSITSKVMIALFQASPF